MPRASGELFASLVVGVVIIVNVFLIIVDRPPGYWPAYCGEPAEYYSEYPEYSAELSGIIGNGIPCGNPLSLLARKTAPAACR